MDRAGATATQSPIPFDPDIPLQRIDEIAIRFHSDGSAHFEDLGLTVGSHALRILEAFSRPLSFRDAMADLQASLRSPQDWIDLGDAIRFLYFHGILTRTDDPERQPTERVGFDAPSEHVLMLNDRARTSAYLRAISEIVKPGDVVVEIGTGTGVLAVAAARAGASRVYAIEAGTIGRTAEAVFAANGFRDRITLIPGRSYNVTLPERADVLVSEIIGNEPFQERVLESTNDAILRFLKSNARVLPAAIRVYGVLLRVPTPVVAGHFFTGPDCTRWSDWYGTTFDALVLANPQAAKRIFVPPHLPRDWTSVSDPTLLTDIDFARGHPAGVECRSEVVATRSDTVNGVLTFFDLRLSPREEISTNPARVDQDSSWRSPLWLLPEPLKVQEGERLTIGYQYPAPSPLRVTLSRSGHAPR